MARLRYEIRCDCVPRDYESILHVYHWIIESASRMSVKVAGISASVDFTLDDISYAVESIEEFKHIAFGHRIIVKSLFVSISIEHIDGLGLTCSVAHISPFDTESSLVISGEDKDLLIELVELLKNYQSNANDGHYGKENEDDGIKRDIIENHTVNNIVAYIDQKQSKSIWKSVWEGILKNIVWVIIVAAILGLLAYLGVQKPDWLHL